MDLPEGAPTPRLCHLIKWLDFDGYGFNLHSEKTKSNCQYVGKVDNSSPAQAAGLREGDRIVEVNGVNISTENHRQVVERIKAIPQETKLLVIDPEGELWYKSRDLVIRGTQPNVVHIKTPVPRPSANNGLNGHSEEESQDEVSSAMNTRTPNFHDLSLSDATAPVCESTPKEEMHLSNGDNEDGRTSKSSNDNPENSVKINGSHEVHLSPEPELESPIKLVPSSQSPVMNGIKSSESKDDKSLNKTSDSINNNNVEEKSKKNSLQKESGLSSEAASSSRSSTCGSPDQLDNHEMIISSKMQPTNGTPKRDVVNIDDNDKAKNVTNGVSHHINNGSSGSRGSSVSTGSIPASPSSMKSSGSANGSKEPTSIANLSTGSSSALFPSNGRPPSDSDMLQMSLNMSVSEMRQMLAQKKKHDPKKAQIDLKQKYEIIQQM